MQEKVLKTLEYDKIAEMLKAKNRDLRRRRACRGHGALRYI